MQELKIIARIKNDFPSKFGIPRQSGLVRSLRAVVKFEKPYDNPDALRGLEEFSHIWLLWGFSEIKSSEWSPTVRPPRLGGNKRLGVFATRSPNRPNSIGLSSVEIERIEPDSPDGPVIHVLGADLLDGTPIYDIKPYIPYTDCHPDAAAGFAVTPPEHLEVIIPEHLAVVIPADKRAVLEEVLSLDPRPQYQDDETRIYGMEFDCYEVKFTVSDKTITVTDISLR